MKKTNLVIILGGLFISACLFLALAVFFDFEINLEPFTIFFGLCLFFTLLSLYFSSRNEVKTFSVFIVLSVIAEFLAQVICLKQALHLFSINPLLEKFALVTIAGSSFSVALFISVPLFLIYGLVFYCLFQNKNTEKFVAYLPHVWMIKVSYAFNLILIPVLVLAEYIFSSDWSRILNYGFLNFIGFSQLFLRLDMLRSLAMGSYSNRNLINISETELNKEKPWNSYAFLFGARWYFYKGLFLKGSLLTLPYLLFAFINLPILYPLYFIGSRIYCALFGNKDYYQMKSKLVHSN